MTPPVLEPAAFRDVLSSALDADDVGCVQLRLKDLGDDAIRRACEVLRPVCQNREVAFILNDRPDIAAACGADGVHVGQQDASYAEARVLMGPDAIVGVTCHDSRHLAMEAAEAGADYVAFGAFYPTATKDAPTRAEVELLRWWSEVMTVPCVAIGGITVENAAPLAEAGADFLAVSAGVWAHPGGAAEAVRAFNRILRAHAPGGAEPAG